MLLVADYIQGL